MAEHQDTIDCPHCGGSGRVPEDFLIEDHVAEVFSDYCTVFGIHPAYGVEAFEDCNGGVFIKQDVSIRGCRNSEAHRLPHSYFTRDRETRLTLMRADQKRLLQQGKRKERSAKRRAIVEHERRATSLRKELSAQGGRP